MVDRLKLGVLANEFFDPALERMGGFGWAARQVARTFEDPTLGVDVVYLTGQVRGSAGQRETVVHGRRLILKQPTVFEDVRLVSAERVDLLLVIDYRPTYFNVCRALPQTPIVFWVRDPRPPEDIAKVDTLRLPETPGVRPKSIIQPDCSSLGTILQASQRTGRPVLFASPAPHLRSKLVGMIRMEIDHFAFLPNPIDLQPGRVRKSEHPRVVFLARLDPYKRPWLFTELARRFPNVDFLLAGKAHYQGEGTWQPRGLPQNVRFLGHIGDVEKVHILSSAWVLINTSIHEGLAVSFLESLACETPLLACVDPGGIVSTYGMYAGRFDGTGLDALPHLTSRLTRLLTDYEFRTQLGKQGREWVESTHTRAAFLKSFRDVCVRAGVTVPAKARATSSNDAVSLA